jgi:hypothetical protein
MLLYGHESLAPAVLLDGIGPAGAGGGSSEHRAAATGLIAAVVVQHIGGQIAARSAAPARIIHVAVGRATRLIGIGLGASGVGVVRWGFVGSGLFLNSQQNAHVGFSH